LVQSKDERIHHNGDAGLPLRQPPPQPVTSIRKAKLVLGWEPRYTFATWLTEYGWKTAAKAVSP